MRILGIYSTDRLLGGGEISLTLTLRAVQSAGHEVLAMVPREGSLSEYLQENHLSVAVAAQESFRRPDRLRRLLWPAPGWIEIVRSFKPDILHCNAIRPALFAQAVGRRLAIPALLHARIETSDPTDPFLMLVLDGIICTSEVVRKRFARRHNRALIQVIHNMVQIEELQKSTHSASLRRQWQESDSDFLIGLPGRFSPGKGHLRLIQAAGRVLNGCPNARFVFIGKADEAWPDFGAQLQREAQEKHLGHRFVFAGFQADMPSAYHALDLVVFPASSEGFGRIVIEAGAARIPLLTNDIEVMREILPSDANDLLVDCDNADLLAERIIELIRNPQHRAAAANRLFQHVSRTFGEDSHRRQILAMYEAVRERRR